MKSNPGIFWMCIGASAAILTTFSFVPQIVKAARTKSAKDVSLHTLLQLSLGVFLWILYGCSLKDPIIIAANSITFVTLSVLIALYFKYGRA